MIFKNTVEHHYQKFQGRKDIFYHVVLISGDCHELGFGKYEGFNIFLALSQVICHSALFFVVKNDMKTRLVFVHRVENNLKEEKMEKIINIITKSVDLFSLLK